MEDWALLDGAFVDVRENVLGLRSSGSGKTHLLCGIACEAVRRGREARLAPRVLLVRDLLSAKRYLRLKRRLKRLSGLEALASSDLEYVQRSRDAMEVLFTLRRNGSRHASQDKRVDARTTDSVIVAHGPTPHDGGLGKRSWSSAGTRTSSSSQKRLSPVGINARCASGRTAGSLS